MKIWGARRLSTACCTMTTLCCRISKTPARRHSRLITMLDSRLDSRIRSDPEIMARWTTFKTETLIEFTQELAAHVGTYRAPFKTVRISMHRRCSIPAARNGSRRITTASCSHMITPPSKRCRTWKMFRRRLRRMAGESYFRCRVKTRRLEATVFELQSVDWRIKDSSRAIPTEELAGR